MEQNIASFREIATGNGGIEERLNAIAQLLWVAKENRKSARVDTSRFYVRNTSKSKRQQLNDNAVNILSQIRAGTLEAKDLSEEQKIALAHYSGCGGGLIGSDGKKGSAYEYYTPKACGMPSRLSASMAARCLTRAQAWAFSVLRRLSIARLTPASSIPTQARSTAF